MFDVKKIIEEQITKVQEVIGNERAIIAVSGGVDSAAAAAIVGKAIGDNLLGIHVDNGLMRYSTKDKIPESEYVTKVLQECGVNVKLIDAQDEFLESLEGIVEPEKKRKIIGEKFIRIFEKEAKEWGTKYLVQGTLAPDWIESGKGLRDNIKSHHNVGGLPEDMDLKLFEPNKDLYKDEVRKIAEEIGLPKEVYKRQPFPGPGLGIRVIGAPLTKENVEIERTADWIWCQTIEDAIESNKIPDGEYQYFTVYAPNWKAVGVHGDKRAYNSIVFLRFFKTIDYMSGEFGKIPMEVIERGSSRITNELKEHISRVAYDVTHKPPGTVEFE